MKILSTVTTVFMLLAMSAQAFEFRLSGNALDHAAVGDMNGDGRPDIVLANQSGDVTIVFNTGNPFPNLFSNAPLNLPAINTPTFIGLGDFNGDGRIDIVSGNSGNGVDVFLQTVSPGLAGTFGTASKVLTGNQPISVVVTDLNNDGKADIVSGNSGLATLGGSSVSVLLGNGNGTFASAVNYVVGPLPVSVATGDINGDRFNDVVVARAGNFVTVLLNNGDGTLLTPFNIVVGDSQKFVSLVDLNADAKLDMAVLLSGGDTNNNIALLMGNGDGTFQSASLMPVPIRSSRFATADITGDGKVDIVLATSIGPGAPSVFGLRGNGDGTFLAATDFQFTVDAFATTTVIADFDNDTQLDIATATVNPSPAGLYIEKLNLKAVVTSFTPTKALANSAAFTLTVNGSNFISGAKVFWNGVARTTTFVSANQLTADIPASDLTTVGRVAVTVVNPAPGGFASDPAVFAVYETTLGLWTVTNTNDSGPGSLRFAMEQAQNADTITFSQSVFDLTNSDAATVINVLSGLPAMDEGAVILDAQNQRVTVNGSGAGSTCGILITSSSNVVRGLSLVGFSQSGVCIQGGAQSNTIGGSRSAGTGPNGQGLRISNCGAFGIEITGAGADHNVVKGCWIGLDSSGAAPQPNLAGILIQNGAKTNVIGGTGAGEGNAISGNSFEGVTSSGTGTDGNIVIGNIIGAAAVETLPASVASREFIPTRGAVGNGSAGVFLSRGTQGGRVGGDFASEGNRVAHNGGNGVEVRSGNSERNAAKFNRISRNIRGGIKLFDGSNNGINPPTLSSVTVATSPAGAASRAAFRARVQGSIDRDGTIEFFNDPADQGEFVLGRAAVPAGPFDVEIDIDDLLNLTATLTDNSGNTSAFASFRGAATDSDSDGVLDALETLAGTNKDDASSVPAVQGVVAADKIQVSLNFASTIKDNLRATLRLAKPDGFLFPGATVGVLFGNHAESVILDSKSKSPRGNVSVRAKISKTGPGVLLTVGIKGTPLQSDLSPSGLQNRTTSGEVLKLFIATTLKDTAGTSFVYTGTVDVTYKATFGKSGKAAKVK